MAPIRRLLEYLRVGMWRLSLKELSPPSSLLVRHLRIFFLALRGFDEDKCRLWASALTFYSLMAIVPVVAMLFGIAKGFGFEKTIQKALYERLQGQEEVLDRVVEFAHNLLDNTRGNLIAGVGVALLFWTVIKVLSNVEKSFNHIWGIKKHRSWPRKFSDYLAFMIICPVLLVIASALPIYLHTQVETLSAKLHLFSSMSKVLLGVLKFSPFFVTWLLFFFLFVLMPNGNVKFRAALFGSIIAGTMFQFAQWGYVKFQVGASRYGAIYGSFMALPLFLTWVQISWLIVLLGAELSFAHQSVETYEYEQESEKISHRGRMVLALLVTRQLVQNFCSDQAPWTTTQLSEKLDVPIRLLRRVLFELTEAGILSEINVDQDKELAYQPARDPHQLTLSRVICALEEHGHDELPILHTKEAHKLRNQLQHLEGVVADAPGNALVKDL